MKHMRRTAVWLGIVAIIAPCALIGYKFWAPHPVHVPATRADAGPLASLTQARIVEEYPQLNASVAQDPGAGEHAPHSTRADSVPASISGRVLDQETGSGLVAATVRLALVNSANLGTQNATRAPISVETGEDGGYQFPEIAGEGEMVLFASAEGYSTQESELHLLRPGRAYEDVDFALKRAVGEIAGRVVDTGHTPIPGAVVEVMAGPEGSGGIAVTDEAGAFTMALPAEGLYVLLVGKDGYGRERFTDIRPGMDHLELVLEEAGGIAGAVTNKTGEPRQGLCVIVEVEPSAQAQAVGESLWHADTVTDANGQYRVGELSANYSYRVRVTIRVSPGSTRGTTERQGLEAYMQSVREMEGKFAEFTYSRSPDAGLARQEGVLVNPGQDTRVDFQIDDADTQSATVYGFVTDPDSGAPVCPVRVQAFWDKSVVWTSWLTSTTTDVDGFYTLSLTGLAGPEHLWITAGYDHSKPVAEVPLEPGAAKELNLLVPSTVTATAHCIDDGGTPIGGLIVTTNGPTRMSDAGGRVTIYGLAPFVSHTLAAYRPQADSTAQGRTPVPEVRVGVSAPFSGKPGEAIPEVLIQCSEPSGSISGQIAVPEEVAEYWHDAGHDILHTRLFYEGAEPYMRTASMDEDYRFSLGQLDPGRCTVLVWLPTSRTKTPKWWWAEIESVEIVSGQNTDLGLVTLNVSDNWWQ